MTNLADSRPQLEEKPAKFVPGQPDMWMFVLFESLLFTGYFSVYLVSRTQNEAALPAVPGRPGSPHRDLQHDRLATELVGDRPMCRRRPGRARTGRR